MQCGETKTQLTIPRIWGRGAPTGAGQGACLVQEGRGPGGGAKSRTWRRSGCGAALSQLSSFAACCSEGESRGSLSRRSAPGVQRPLDYSLVRGEVGLAHGRLQSLPGFPRRWRRVQMFLPGWAELRRRGPTEPGKMPGLRSSDPRRSPPLRDANRYSVTSGSYRETRQRRETWGNPSACLVAIYVADCEPPAHPSPFWILIIAWRIKTRIDFKRVFWFWVFFFLGRFPSLQFAQKSAFLAIVCHF